MKIVSKDLKLSVLLDFYGDVLTDKQRDVMELYYNEDLSLAEIAEHENISRQGVRDSIKRGEESILHLEEKLMMADKFSRLSKLIDDIRVLTENIYNESSTYNYSKVITLNSKSILDLIKDNNDIL